jgi:hypothetical protein
VKLHSSFNKRTGFSQNCNSERGQLAELLPNSGSGCITECDSGSGSDHYSSAANRGKCVQFSGSASGESTNRHEYAW